MARILPARPRISSVEGEALAVLESRLNDDYVVIQKGPAPQVVVVGHPDLGLCAVAVLAGNVGYDVDAEAWGTLDPEAMARVVADWATPRQVRVGSLGYLPGTPRPAQGSPGNLQDLVFSGEEDMFTQLVPMAMARNAPCGDDAIDTLIQAVSPGATPYARGQVTEPQRLWRLERDGVAVPSMGTHAVEVTFPTHAPGSAVAPGGTERPRGSTASTVQGSMARTEPPRPPMEPDNPMLLLVRQAAETVADRKPILIEGVEISAEEMTAPDFLLPALLVVAAEDWAPVVVLRKGVGGFHMRLRSNPDSILGYSVVDISPSAPLLMILPVINRLRRSVKVLGTGDEALVMDSTVHRFGRWLTEHRFDASLVQDIDMRVALQGS